MEMKHRLKAPVDHFPKTATLPSHKNPASQEISDSLHVRQGATSFNFFGHCIDIFLRCPCVPELNGLWKYLLRLFWYKKKWYLLHTINFWRSKVLRWPPAHEHSRVSTHQGDGHTLEELS